MAAAILAGHSCACACLHQSLHPFLGTFFALGGVSVVIVSSGQLVP